MIIQTSVDLEISDQLQPRSTILNPMIDIEDHQLQDQHLTMIHIGVDHLKLIKVGGGIGSDLSVRNAGGYAGVPHDRSVDGRRSRLGVRSVWSVTRCGCALPDGMAVVQNSEIAQDQQPG